MNLLDRVLEHEGFRSKPYQDHLGVWTIGHGLTFLTEKESKRIVQQRLTDLTYDLIRVHRWLVMAHNSKIILDTTTEMAFQMGLTGCLNFKNMWKALESLTESDDG